MVDDREQQQDTDGSAGVMDVFIDTTSNLPRTEQFLELFRESLRSRFERDLPAVVERTWELPAVVLQQPRKEYVALLVEARSLFVEGKFYACVAMCGIVGERLVKDALREAVLIEANGRVQRPSEQAFEQFERVDVGAIVRFLQETGKLSKEASKALASLAQLRNAYAHARGKNPQRDALEAIQTLHVVVESTVSIFKDLVIGNGAFVSRSAGQERTSDA